MIIGGMPARDYRRRYMYSYSKERREEAKSLLGGKCELCGSTKELGFAHLEYKEPRGRYRGGPYMEAILHPERFLLLCHDCHKHPERHLRELVDLKARLLRLEAKLIPVATTGGGA